MGSLSITSPRGELEAHRLPHGAAEKERATMLASKAEFTDQVAAIDPSSWRKSRRSGPISDNCVELAPVGDTGAVAMRDSKNPSGAVLVFTAGEIEAFIGGAKDGEFDDLVGA
jgi:hypothetical protein